MSTCTYKQGNGAVDKAIAKLMQVMLKTHWSSAAKNGQGLSPEQAKHPACDHVAQEGFHNSLL